MGGDVMGGESDNLLLQMSGRARFLRDTRSEVKTPSIIDSAISRIEQLERELEDVRGLERDTYAASKAAFIDLQEQLAAEKALADRLYPWVQKYAPAGANIGADEDIAAYRKARGL